MKCKKLCNRCLGDKNAFKRHINAYNNGKCYECNNHGYKLTSDYLKATEANIKYLNTISRLTEQLHQKTLDEINALNELKQAEKEHQEKHSELYEKLNKTIEDMTEALKKDPSNALQELEVYKEINKRWNATQTNEYKYNIKSLEKEIKAATKQKEKAVNELNKAQQFYNDLLKVVD